MGIEKPRSEILQWQGKTGGVRRASSDRILGPIRDKFLGGVRAHRHREACYLGPLWCPCLGLWFRIPGTLLQLSGRDSVLMAEGQMRRVPVTGTFFLNIDTWPAVRSTFIALIC